MQDLNILKDFLNAFKSNLNDNNNEFDPRLIDIMQEYLNGNVQITDAILRIKASSLLEPTPTRDQLLSFMNTDLGNPADVKLYSGILYWLVTFTKKYINKNTDSRLLTSNVPQSYFEYISYNDNSIIPQKSFPKFEF